MYGKIISTQSHLSREKKCQATVLDEENRRHKTHRLMSDISSVIIIMIICHDNLRGNSSKFFFHVISNKSIMFQSVITTNDWIKVEVLSLPYTPTPTSMTSLGVTWLKKQFCPDVLTELRKFNNLPREVQ